MSVCSRQHPCEKTRARGSRKRRIFKCRRVEKQMPRKNTRTALSSLSPPASLLNSTFLKATVPRSFKGRSNRKQSRRSRTHRRARRTVAQQEPGRETIDWLSEKTGMREERSEVIIFCEKRARVERIFTSLVFRSVVIVGLIFLDYTLNLDS